MARRVPTDELVRALREVAQVVEGPLTSTAYLRHRPEGAPAASTIMRHFVTWARALEHAGLPRGPGRSWRRWSLEDTSTAITAWLQATDDHGYSAYRAAAATDPALPSRYFVTRHFGSWTAAVAELDRR